MSIYNSLAPPNVGLFQYFLRRLKQLFGQKDSFLADLLPKACCQFTTYTRTTIDTIVREKH